MLWFAFVLSIIHNLPSLDYFIHETKEYQLLQKKNVHFILQK